MVHLWGKLLLVKSMGLFWIKVIYNVVNGLGQSVGPGSIPALIEAE